MQELSYTVSFTTPAFLGNAEQQAQWRTAPFKALLRQWWRVAYAADKQFQINLAEMRKEEGILFGQAHDGDNRKSLVRIRLNHWEKGSMSRLDKSNSVFHPEVERAGYQVEPNLYLGYGPINNKTTDSNKAIAEKQINQLDIAFPSSHKDPEINQILLENKGRLLSTLWLINKYGTVGGRSRNGWGSVSLVPLNEESKLFSKLPLRSWKEVMNDVTHNWAHAIGKDDKPLMWQTGECDDWKAVMRVLAVIKIGLRTQFVFRTGNTPTPENRHWLSYPLSPQHKVTTWREQGRGDFRLPNSLRFKVRHLPNGKCVGVIFHLPCRPPNAFKPDLPTIMQTWQKVHSLLDELTKNSNERQYASIPIERDCRNKLSPHLDTVKLARIAE